MISILIASWNTHDFLKDCLNSIQDTIFCDIEEIETEVVVVDNASTDHSAEMVKANFPWVHLVVNSQNIGFGQANNLALQQAHGNFLLLLNPDTILHSGAVSGMLTFLLEHPDVGAVGPRILNQDGSIQTSVSRMPTLSREAWRLFHLDGIRPYSTYSRDKPEYLQMQDVDVLKGACIMIRSDVIDQIGLFDEQFFVYSEEVDLCYRIRNAGWRIVWLPECQITHFGGESTKQIPDQMFIELYRNKVRFFRKHQGWLGSVIYKGILFLASLVRWLPGALFKNSRVGKKHDWGTISRQYRQLICQLPAF